MTAELATLVVQGPGPVLQCLLQKVELSQRVLAERMRISEKHLSQVLSGQAQLTYRVAVLFERELGLDANLIMGVEARRRLDEARTNLGVAPKFHV